MCTSCRHTLQPNCQSIRPESGPLWYLNSSAEVSAPVCVCVGLGWVDQCVLILNWVSEWVIAYTLISIAVFLSIHPSSVPLLFSLTSGWTQFQNQNLTATLQNGPLSLSLYVCGWLSSVSLRKRVLWCVALNNTVCDHFKLAFQTCLCVCVCFSFCNSPTATERGESLGVATGYSDSSHTGNTYRSLDVPQSAALTSHSLFIEDQRKPVKHTHMAQSWNLTDQA